MHITSSFAIRHSILFNASLLYLTLLYSYAFNLHSFFTPYTQLSGVPSMPLSIRNLKPLRMTP